MIELVTKPAAFPVTLQETKAHARITKQSEDAMIDLMIAAATDQVETMIDRALINRTYRMYLDSWPVGQSTDPWWDGVRDGAISALFSTTAQTFVELRGPIVSVTSVKTYTDADVATVFSSASYYVDTKSVPGRIALRTGAAWPIPTRLTNGIEIEWVAGYGANINALAPVERVRLAIMQTVAHWYENREPALAGGNQSVAAVIPMHVAAILSSLKKITL